MGMEHRFSYPYVSGDSTFGELVTALKLQQLGSYPRDTLLDLLGDLLCRKADGTKDSGVVSGMAVTPSATVEGLLHVETGLALYYSLAQDVAGNLAISPIVCNSGEAESWVTLEAPDSTNNRYDLIVARPAGALADYATRQVMLADGSKSTQNLPARYGEGVLVVAIPGTPAASPVAPDPTLGDVVLASVLVTADSAPHVIPANCVFDAREFLSPYVGGVNEYQVTAKGSADGSLEDIVERVSNPSIHVATSIARSAEGAYAVTLEIPARMIPDGVSPLVEATVQTVGAYGALTTPFVVNPILDSMTGSSGGEMLKSYTIAFTTWQESAGAFAKADLSGIRYLNAKVTFPRA